MKKLLLALLIASELHGQSINFPLKQSQDKRFIIDQDNKPIFLKGIAAWRIGYDVAYNDAKTFLDDRKAKGYNTIIIEITPDQSKGGDVPNLYGQHCFINRDVSKPNPKFFEHADSILQLCSDMNVAVLLFPLYLGCCHDGWLEILREKQNNPAKCKSYGAWVARRYKHLKNLIWASGGDYNETAESLAFAEGIASVDTSHLHTYHGAPGFTSTERVPNKKWLSLSCIYTYFPFLTRNDDQYQVYAQLYKEATRNKSIPFIMAESAYEYERKETTQTLRRQAYWALFSQASGHIFGNRDIWMMNKNWPNALNTPGNQSMVIFHRFVDSIKWQNLKPDWTHMMFVSGRGEFNAGTSPGGDEYATGAVSEDGKTAFLYLPTYRKVGINLSRFKNEVKVTWFDPSSGKRYVNEKNLTKGPIAYLEPPTFNNEQGFDDWLLIVEEVGGN